MEDKKIDIVETLVETKRNQLAYEIHDLNCAIELWFPDFVEELFSRHPDFEKFRYQIKAPLVSLDIASEWARHEVLQSLQKLLEIPGDVLRSGTVVYDKSFEVLPGMV